MAYDRDLAEAIRALLGTAPGVSEKRMFGGLAFLVDARMAVAASRDGGLMVRVDPSETEALVAQPHVDRFVMRGRALDGWLAVGACAVASEENLRGWVERGVTAAHGLPARTAGAR